MLALDMIPVDFLMHSAVPQSRRAFLKQRGM